MKLRMIAGALLLLTLGMSISADASPRRYGRHGYYRQRPAVSINIPLPAIPPPPVVAGGCYGGNRRVRNCDRGYYARGNNYNSYNNRNYHNHRNYNRRNCR